MHNIFIVLCFLPLFQTVRGFQSSMFVNDGISDPEHSLSILELESEDSEHVSDGESDRKTICDIYMMKLLNKILNVANLQDVIFTEKQVVAIPLKLYVSSKSLNVVHSFAKGKNNPYSWPELEAAFADLLEIKQEIKDDFQSENSPNPGIIIVTVISCLLFTTFWLILKGVSVIKSLSLVFIIAFAIGLGTTWLKEIEEKRIESIMNIPEECINGESKSDCKDFHRAQADPISRVVFTDVFAKTFATMFAVALPILGDAIGKAMSSFTQNLPWVPSFFISWITIPLLLPILVCLTILIGCIVFCGPGLMLSTPLGSIKTANHEKIPANLEYKKKRPKRNIIKATPVPPKIPIES